MAPLLPVGAAVAFLAVVLGAFGTHTLARGLTPERTATYRTGVQYHLFHSLAILVAVLLRHAGLASPLALVAGWLWVAGVVLFSGSLYALAGTGARRLGAITPVGGLCFLAGWVLALLAVLGGRA